jgi:F-type H+-transporting ATPase subunit b
MPALLPLLAAVQEGEGGGGFTPFSINVALVGWTVLIFLLLMALLWKFGWPAILKSVEERERRIQEQLDQAARARDEAVRLLEEHKKTIAGARAEAHELIARGKAAAEKERAALLAKAREEQESLLERARKENGAERDKAILALRREAVDLAIAAASKLVEKNLDTAANRRLVTDYLASIAKQS